MKNHTPSLGLPLSLCLCLVATSEALAPSQLSSLCNIKHKAVTSSDRVTASAPATAPVRSPLFCQEKKMKYLPNSSHEPSVSKNMFQRFFSKRSALVAATTIALCTTSLVWTPEPVHAAANTRTPIETAVEKYSVSFWTPESDVPSQHSQQQGQQTAIRTRTKVGRTKNIKRAAANMEKRKAVAQKYSQATKKLQQQRQRTLQQSRGGHYQYNYYGDGSVGVQQQQRSGIMGATLTFTLLTITKLTFLATMVVAFVAAGNEDFADTIRERITTHYEDWAYYRSSSSSTMGEHAKDRLAKAKALVVLSSATVTTKSKNAAFSVCQRATDRWNSLVVAYHTAIQKYRNELDKKYDPDSIMEEDYDGYEAARDMDALMLTEREAAVAYAQKSTTSGAAAAKNIDQRLEKFYNRVREEERGKMMASVMLRKASDEEYFEEISKAEAYRQQHKTEVTSYGLRRVSSDTKAGSYSIPPIKPTPSSDERIRKILKEPSMYKTPPGPAATQPAAKRNAPEKSRKVREAFDIRYMMWKLLARDRRVSTKNTKERVPATKKTLPRRKTLPRPANQPQAHEGVQSRP